MFYSVGGKIVEVGGKIAEKRFNTLTFQTIEDSFPKENGGFGYVKFYSTVEQSIIVNYGDGFVESYLMKNTGGKFETTINAPATYDSTSSSESYPGHFFNDTQNNGNLRNVSITFVDITKIFFVGVDFNRIQGTFPFELTLMTGLKNIFLRRLELEQIPDDYKGLLNLEEFIVVDAYSNNSFKPTKLEDWLFNSKLKLINVSGSYDLSQNNTNNFFKINQLSDYLTNLIIIECNIQHIPNELEELKNLKSINIYATENIKVLERLNPDLIQIRYGWKDNNGLADIDYQINLPYKKLTVLHVNTKLTVNMINEIPVKFKLLKSLKSWNVFYQAISNENFDLFIDNFYELCTVNGFLDPASQEAINTGYPEQFRDFSWGDGTYTQTGTIQAPAGFVLGTDNGTPANQGEKIYVLVNNYGHTVTTV